MSNEPTIEQMDKAIAEFMQLETDNESYLTPGRTRTVYLIDGIWVPLRKLKYHSSWDALMPCWKKAGVILYSIRRELDGEKYLEAYRITKCFLDACQKVDIERAHEAVYNAVQFIQWYNNQSTTTNE